MYLRSDRVRKNMPAKKNNKINQTRDRPWALANQFAKRLVQRASTLHLHRTHIQQATDKRAQPHIQNKRYFALENQV